PNLNLNLKWNLNLNPNPNLNRLLRATKSPGICTQTKISIKWAHDETCQPFETCDTMCVSCDGKCSCPPPLKLTIFWLVTGQSNG
ncbi:hypothetical protein M5D96_011944, partial [Drosophila gunungcola]